MKSLWFARRSHGLEARVPRASYFVVCSRAAITAALSPWNAARAALRSLAEASFSVALRLIQNSEGNRLAVRKFEVQNDVVENVPRRNDAPIEGPDARRGFEWRIQGCSMCLAMNADRLEPGQRCASTSNRNFEGRQGKGGRTHLVSPLVAAATAIRGTLSSPSDVA